MLQAGRQAVRQAWGFVRPGSDRCFVAAPLAIPADRSRASRWPVKSKTLRGSMFQAGRARGMNSRHKLRVGSNEIY